MSDPTLYGPAHKAERARWQARMDAGETVRCARGCGRILNDRPWDLGHLTRTTYRGPECIPCNRATATHRATQQRRPKPPHPGLIGD